MSRRMVRAACGAALVAALALATPISALASGGRSHTGPGVFTSIAYPGDDVQLTFLFGGTEATAFVLAVPSQASLASLSATVLRGRLHLTTLSGEQVHFHFLTIRRDSVSVGLHSPQPTLVLSLGPHLFRWSSAEAAKIAAGHPGHIHAGVAFTGSDGPSELIPSRFTFVPR